MKGFIRFLLPCVVGLSLLSYLHIGGVEGKKGDDSTLDSVTARVVPVSDSKAPEEEPDEVDNGDTPPDTNYAESQPESEPEPEPQTEPQATEVATAIQERLADITKRTRWLKSNTPRNAVANIAYINDDISYIVNVERNFGKSSIVRGKLLQGTEDFIQVLESKKWGSRLGCAEDFVNARNALQRAKNTTAWSPFDDLCGALQSAIRTATQKLDKEDAKAAAAAKAAKSAEKSNNSQSKNSNQSASSSKTTTSKSSNKTSQQKATPKTSEKPKTPPEAPPVAQEPSTVTPEKPKTPSQPSSAYVTPKTSEKPASTTPPQPSSASDKYTDGLVYYTSWDDLSVSC